jgi:hypothetical protein
MDASGAAVRLLVQYGADVNATNNVGVEPVLHALPACPKPFRALAVLQAGHSPIALSVLRANYAVTAALIKAGAEMNTVCVSQ